MIVVTGSAGFIGSCMIEKLNSEGITSIVSVDVFVSGAKERNFSRKKVDKQIDRSDFVEWFAQHASEVSAVIHLGARTDTTEKSWQTLLDLNLEFSQAIWKICAQHQIPLVYASSAATYGDGSKGYDDYHETINSLEPLNLYGKSKNDFDKWALAQSATPPSWFGLKFFNVYGPNEYHKGRMASVVFHSFYQIREMGKVKLFRSHKEGYEDGMQLRDFVYVKDVVDVISFLLKEKPQSGIYNLGTGEARSFYDLAQATFAAMQVSPQIEFIDMPEDLRGKYQYFTEANMQKLVKAGYPKPFSSLEEGVRDYVVNYLQKDLIY